MKISFEWLSDFVSWKNADPRAVAERLTLSTAEVEKVEVQGALLRHCVVGQVLTVLPHPNADKLRLCDVQTDRGKKRVVCGGENLSEGMLVAFAHVGARVRWHGEGDPVELTTAKIRGQESEGMICAAAELELEEQFSECVGRKIIELKGEQFTVGAPLHTVLGLTDTVFHIDNHAITQRPDLFSHLGIARECVALGLGTWRKDRPTFSPPVFTKDSLPFSIQVEDARLMPRYCACIVEIEKQGETPSWMRKRLLSTGWRPVRLPVDITNYVAMEAGVPLHSFDADDIRGEVSMRRARAREKITTLDGKEWELSPGSLVLSDDAGIFDLLGVMGGFRSSTKESTHRIYLHSASLDPVSIRRTMMETGIRTHAGTVYEKGIPHVVAEQGFYRAAQLFLDLVPGARIASRLVSKGKNGNSTPITLSLDRVCHCLGTAVPATAVKRTLMGLEFRVAGSAKTLKVTPPFHRTDIREEADIIEEIARASGYEKPPPALPAASITPPPREHRLRSIRQLLTGFGFCECVSLPLVSLPEGVTTIDNPLLDEQCSLHQSTLPNLLRAAKRNLERGPRGIALFEIAHVFSENGQHLELGVLLSPGGQEAVLHLRSILLSTLRRFGWEGEVKEAQTPYPFAHTAREASLWVAGKNVGALFELHPNLRRQYDLPGRSGAMRINLSVLLACPSREAEHCAPSPYPTISYDETVRFPRNVPARSILKTLEGTHEHLQDVHLLRAYEQGPQISYTFRLTYGAHDRTLTEQEVRPIHADIAMKLQGQPSTPSPRTPAFPC